MSQGDLGESAPPPPPVVAPPPPPPKIDESDLYSIKQYRCWPDENGTPICESIVRVFRSRPGKKQETAALN